MAGPQDHVMPREYVETMQATMLDHCPVSPFSEVRRIILEDLGADGTELLSSMAEQPLASASLAQVCHHHTHLHAQSAVCTLPFASTTSSPSAVCWSHLPELHFNLPVIRLGHTGRLPLLRTAAASSRELE